MAEYTGRVYDLDRNAGGPYTQVLMESPPGDSLIAVSGDPNLDLILGTGLLTGSKKTLVYHSDSAPKKVSGARVVGAPVPDPGYAQVTAVDQDIADPGAWVEILDSGAKTSNRYSIRDIQHLPIVLASLMRPEVKFEYSAADGKLTRAKLNRG